jgi:hypothetical protein
MLFLVVLFAGATEPSKTKQLSDQERAEALAAMLAFSAVQTELSTAKAQFLEQIKAAEVQHEARQAPRRQQLNQKSQEYLEILAKLREKYAMASNCRLSPKAEWDCPAAEVTNEKSPIPKPGSESAGN